MRSVTAQWIANAVLGELAADVDTVVTGVEKDSRAITQGGMYVAFVGERVDGHDFVDQAMANGAVLCLVSQPVAAPHVLVDDVTRALGALARAYLALLRTEGSVTVVGITGSNGKTSTKDLLAQVLPDVVAPVGSFNNEIGLPLTVLRAGSETRHLVLELGASAPGDISYLTAIAPLNVAAVLTVGSAHAQFYPTPEHLAAEKASILDGLLPGGVAVLNADDSRVAGMVSRPPRHGTPAGTITVRTFGTAGGTDVVATNMHVGRGRAEFDVEAHGESARVRLSLVGEHHVTNALAAITVALACGMSVADAAAKVSAATPLSAHRMAVVERGDGVTIIDDAYNASPESMRAALRALLAVAQGGRSWAVIGEMREMGDASYDAHAAVGHDAVRLNISHLLVVGAGAKPAFDMAVREGSWGDEAHYVATIDEAREMLAQRLEPGDTVLVKASHGSHLWQLADQLVEGDG